jgi:hypothetical protein
MPVHTCQVDTRMLHLLCHVTAGLHAMHGYGQPVCHV